MVGRCPYCDEVDELIAHDGERMCFLCAEEFSNKDAQLEDEMRSSFEDWDED